MGTKNNPSDFDCYKDADNDEPMFILLARDECAPDTIRYWCEQRLVDGKNHMVDNQIKEALSIATEMETYKS